MEPTTPTLPPTYKQMLEEMGKQLNNRKGDLMKRVLLITWPVLLLIVVGYFFSKVGGFDTFPQLNTMGFVVGIALYIFAAAVYTFIMRFIFSIEKRIWVDSFFDQKNLSLQESWKISLRLFWPAFTLRLKLWTRYIGLPLFVLVIAALILINTLVVSGGVADNAIGIVLIGFVVVFILFAIYTYYIRIKLRYSWFIFLDKFGKDDSFGSVVVAMNTLNSVSKSETFKKSLIVNLGTDSTQAVANLAVGLLSSGISTIGGAAGKMVGGLVRAYGEEMSRQATELGNIAGQYILYRFARKEAFGNEQEVNENLYNI